MERLILPRMGIYPFRCRRCDVRLYAWGRTQAHEIHGFRGAVLQKMYAHSWLPPAALRKKSPGSLEATQQASA